VCITSFENWKNIISKVPKEGDVKDVGFQVLKATMYKYIGYEESKFENFVGLMRKKLLMTSVEDFGGA
jgi:hypothetical protein